MFGLESKLKQANKNIENQNERVVDRVVEVDISKIKKNDNNFYDENYEIDVLAESVKEVGLIEPLLVNRDYLLISGHRRLNACKLAGLDKVFVKFVADDMNVDLAIIEANRYRKKTPGEEYREILTLKAYYEQLEKEGKKPKGRIRTLIATSTGLSEATVQRRLDLESNDVVDHEAALGNDSELVSNDTKAIKKAKAKATPLEKLEKQINKMIVDISNGKVEVSNRDLFTKLKELSDELAIENEKVIET